MRLVGVRPFSVNCNNNKELIETRKKYELPRQLINIVCHNSR